MGKQEVLERLKTDMPFYAENCLKIINKDAETVPFRLNEGQLALDQALEEQRKAGKPMRALVLKARQVGFSTYTQGKLIQRTTLYENRSALVVAHDTKTGDHLFRIGQYMYAHLPEDPLIKPPLRHHRRGRYLHFAPEGEAWRRGETFPNSSYFVDTAGEFEAARGGTYQFAHLSEFAFWERPEQKLNALGPAIPQRPNTIIIIESTANGMNTFYELWTDAKEGRGPFIPFFWAWWQEPSYTLPFANEREKEDFIEHEVGRGPYGEEEPELLEMGLTYEQLHWRRMTIAGPECAGDLEKFHQEYPSSPEQAFITTGQQVFDPRLVHSVLIQCDITDPERGPGGPAEGTFEVAEKKQDVDRGGDTIIVPTRALWVPREEAMTRDLVRCWMDDPKNPPSNYVIGVDVAGGGVPEGYREPAYHAIQVIDHKSREQVAEYRSRIDSNALAKLLLLMALHFNNAWVAVEVTGGWGQPVINRLYHDYRYPRCYLRRAHDKTTQDPSRLLGWHTTTVTKPLMEAHAAEMLREGTHGIKSRLLAGEMLTYVKDERSRSGPEVGRFSDLLIAWMIAQQVATELPILLDKPPRRQAVTPRDPITGY